jgi:hypothetical protein
VRSFALAAALLLGTAAAAQAYPTALINVPTAGVDPFKSYHLGVYNYLQPSVVPTPNSPYSLTGGFSVGVSPYFDLAPGISAGAVEVGVDGFFPYPSPLYPSTGLVTDTSFLVQPHAKVGLLKETDVLPGIGLGAYYFSAPSLDTSANMVHFSLTKSVRVGDWDLGQGTVGLYHGNPASLGNDYNGFMAGYFHNLPAGAYAMADYTTGQHHLGGTNLAVGYSVNPMLSITGGYFLANEGRNIDKAFLFLDWVGQLPI